MRFRHSVAVTIAAAGFVCTAVRAQQTPALPDILQTAADALVQYSQKLGAVELDEALTQRETTAGQFGAGHTWKADFVLLGLGNGGVTGFRDLYELENSPVRDRSDRLVKLLVDPPSNALEQARKVTADSARFVMAPAMTTFNSPTLALEFLRKENQARSTFKLDNIKTTNGARVAQVRFSEKTKPGLLGAADPNASTQGRFWMDVASGAVRQTELLFDSKSGSAQVNVTYALDPKLGLWLPATMSEQYDITAADAASGSATTLGAGAGYGSHQTIECRVTYSNVRQSAVDLAKLGK